SSTLYCHTAPPPLHSFPTRRSSDLHLIAQPPCPASSGRGGAAPLVRHRGDARRRGQSQAPSRTLSHRRAAPGHRAGALPGAGGRSEEHTSELQSRENLVCRLLLEKK